AALQRALLAAIHSGLVRSAHDTAEGGLAVALVECAFAASEARGMEVELADEIGTAALLFGETQSRVVVSCHPDDWERLAAMMAEHGVPAARIGTVGAPGGQFRITTRAGVLDATVTELVDVYESAIPRRMDGSVGDIVTSLRAEVQNGQE
ncbi:MAG TPA: AIR synthase-related protein, partial [Longimicrobium sp.]